MFEAFSPCAPFAFSSVGCEGAGWASATGLDGEEEEEEDDDDDDVERERASSYCGRRKTGDFHISHECSERGHRSSPCAPSTVERSVCVLSDAERERERKESCRRRWPVPDGPRRASGCMESVSRLRSTRARAMLGVG